MGIFYHFLNVSFYLCWSEEILRKAASILVNKCHGRFISRIYHKRLTSYDQGDRLLPPLPDGGRRIVSVHILHAPDNLHPSDNVLWQTPELGVLVSVLVQNCPTFSINFLLAEAETKCGHIYSIISFKLLFHQNTNYLTVVITARLSQRFVH